MKDKILATEKTEDKYEFHGFKYNEDTFDELFVKKFHDVVNISTESSDDEKEMTDIVDLDDVDTN